MSTSASKSSKGSTSRSTARHDARRRRAARPDPLRDPALARALLAQSPSLSERLQDLYVRGFLPGRPHPRVREGAGEERDSSPAWDRTVWVVSREHKEWAERLRGEFARLGRIPPQWEFFEMLLLLADRGSAS